MAIVQAIGLNELIEKARVAGQLVNLYAKYIDHLLSPDNLIHLTEEQQKESLELARIFLEHNEPTTQDVIAFFRNHTNFTILLDAADELKIINIEDYKVQIIREEEEKKINLDIGLNRYNLKVDYVVSSQDPPREVRFELCDQLQNKLYICFAQFSENQYSLIVNFRQQGDSYTPVGDYIFAGDGQHQTAEGEQALSPCKMHVYLANLPTSDIIESADIDKDLIRNIVAEACQKVLEDESIHLNEEISGSIKTMCNTALYALGAEHRALVING